MRVWSDRDVLSVVRASEQIVSRTDDKQEYQRHDNPDEPRHSISLTATEGHHRDREGYYTDDPNDRRCPGGRSCF